MLQHIKAHHIGFVVKSLKNSISDWEAMGYEKTDNIFYDNIQNNKLVFMKNCNDMRIELLEPLNNSSTILNAPIGFHHICFSVSGNNFESNFKDLYIGKIYTKRIIAPALNNSHICFAYLRNGINVEFLLIE